MIWTWILAKILPLLTVPVLAGGLLFSVGGLGLTWWHLHEANGTIAERDKTIDGLNADLAKARLETQQEKSASANFHAQVEMDRADANAKALSEQTRLQAQITDLSSRVVTTERARKAASDDLLKVLHAVPPEQQNTLSPAVRDALKRVRDIQTGANNPPAATAASGGQNGSGVPVAPIP